MSMRWTASASRGMVALTLAAGLALGSAGCGGGGDDDKKPEQSTSASKGGGRTPAPRKASRTNRWPN